MRDPETIIACVKRENMNIIIASTASIIKIQEFYQVHNATIFVRNCTCLSENTS